MYYSPLGVLLWSKPKPKTSNKKEDASVGGKYTNPKYKKEVVKISEALGKVGDAVRKKGIRILTEAQYNANKNKK